MRRLLGAVLVLILMSFPGGHATRYLPSIVWDHLNPMLSCKCNWFNQMTMMEIYDRFEFLCPTQKITVRLLDSYSRPDDQMNLNLFQRKWTGGHNEEGINKLKRQMMNGSFCDPESSETQRLYTCKNGQDGQGKTIRFARDTNFYKDDIVVFFNNGNDGRESTLSSKEKKCAMALVTKLTWGVAMKYDFTYGKNLTADREKCKNVSCNEERITNPNKTISQPTSTKSSQIISTESSQITNTENTQIISTKASKPANPNCTTILVNASSSGRSSSESWDNFKHGALVGCGVTLLIIFLIGVAYYIICRKSKTKGRKKNCVCHYKTGDQCQSSIVNELGSEKEAGALPQKPPLPKNGQGHNNIGYRTQTMERRPAQ